MIKVLTLISFLLGVSSAFILYLESAYLKTAAKTDNITFFYLGAYALALILICYWHRLIQIFGKANVFLFSLGIKAIIVAYLAFSPMNYAGAWMLALYMTLTTLAWIDLDILLESFSKDKLTGGIRGIYLTVVSAGYLFSQFFSGTLVDRYGFQASIKASLLFLTVILIIALIKVRKIPFKNTKTLSFPDIIRKISGRKNVLRAYYVSFLLQLFYALMIVYTPLFMLDIGFSWTEIGKIFAIMLLPFVLLQYPAGILADRKIEEKWIIIFGLLVMGIATGSIFFLGVKIFWLWALVLFVTRIGASLVELASDSYFYKRIDCEDVYIINFFRNVRPISYIIGITFAAPIVFYFHISAIFPIIGVFVLTGIPFALKFERCKSKSKAQA